MRPTDCLDGPRLARCLWLAILLSASPLASADAPQWMTLPQAPGQDGVQVALTKAEGGSPRSPVVVFLHGSCGTEPYQLGSFEQWSRWFAARGIATLLVDSYRGRGLDGSLVCRTDASPGWLGKRADDAARAIDWVLTTDWVDVDRVLVFGESQGGRSALALAFRSKRRYPTVGMYINCPQDYWKTHDAMSDFPPSLVILGELDALAPPERCRTFLSELRAKGGNADAISLVVMPGAYHAFDFPGISGRFSIGRVEYSGAATEASRKEVGAFLARLGWSSR